MDSLDGKGSYEVCYLGKTVECVVNLQQTDSDHPP